MPKRIRKVKIKLKLKPCLFCEADYFVAFADVLHTGCSVDPVFIENKFCPMCGRKIKKQIKLRSNTMCEFQILKTSPEGEELPPKCDYTGSLCTLCVLGNAKTYKEALEHKKGVNNNGKI